MSAPLARWSGAPVRVAVLVVATVALVVVQLGLAWPVAAHAELVATEPAAGATVTTLDSVRLSFSDALAPEFSTVTVLSPGGAPVDGGPSTVSDTEISVPVNVSGAGAYTIVYRVLSADGHPIEGTYAVTRAPTAVPTTGPSQRSSDAPAEPVAPPTAAPAPTPSPAATWGLGGGVIGSVAAVAGIAWYRRAKDSRTTVGG